MSNTFIYCWNRFSEGGKELAKALGIPRIRHKRDNFKGAPDKTVVNWGSTKVPVEILRCKVINSPQTVLSNTNKLLFFRKMMAEDAPRIPAFTTEKSQVQEWLKKQYSV